MNSLISRYPTIILIPPDFSIGAGRIINLNIVSTQSVVRGQ